MHEVMFEDDDESTAKAVLHSKSHSLSASTVRGRQFRCENQLCRVRTLRYAMLRDANETDPSFLFSKKKKKLLCSCPSAKQLCAKLDHFIKLPE